MVFLTRSDRKILIQRRNREKEAFPDCYDASCAFPLTFGESHEDAAWTEMVEETGVSARLAYLAKFTHYDSPENEIVAVFAYCSDEPVVIDGGEPSAAMYCTKEEVDEIIESKTPSPWFKVAWRLVRGRV
jgi:isopentenyldiphosphate isomerase